MKFNDHFSTQSKNYADSRPDYPVALYAFIVSRLDNYSLCWDVATGSGQAAQELAKYFDRVVATDASAAQLQQAAAEDNISYRNEQAEHTSLDDQSVDLVTVAQAAHWFEFDAFYAEVKRVLKPAGMIAVWAYGASRISPEIDTLVQYLYADVLGAYWPSERRFIDQMYRQLPFPFKQLKVPELVMEKNWSLEQFCAYLNSWSAVQRYIEAKDSNPVDELRETLRCYWGDQQTVRWPLVLLAGK